VIVQVLLMIVTRSRVADAVRHLKRCATAGPAAGGADCVSITPKLAGIIA
jgi:hypothetical protein